ncbi:MAG: hypothetical protein HY017_20215 [Betaproteobacteria bacterium]|nr:hypothetical protein [Betaproteobacteria bacterium]
MQSVKLSVTVRRNLERKYDGAALKQIDAAVKRWVAADAARGIKTVHVALDDAVAMKKLGVAALKGAATAEKMKTAIDRLWTRLAPEYLVLFGSQDVVPYFIVDNPSFSPDGDDDKIVPTDNPYACSGAFRKLQRSSYLVPDRVVGRIPDMPSATDPSWLLDYMETATNWSSQTRNAFADGYVICCDAWKGAALKCVEYIGEAPSQLLVSPPAGDASADARTRLGSKLHMIKCHGAQLDPKFYGQKGNSYPDALFSGTLKPEVKAQMLAAAMCCYGAQVYSPNDPAASLPGEWPIASTYLRQGALGFAGSTMIAWVGADQMMCADWIVASYLKGALGGASLGRAFLESKQDYICWLNQQGQVPDLADEKTLVEYVLLADPSIHPVAAAPGPALAAAGGTAAAVAARPSPLALQERHQRRVVRAQMAAQMRGILPTRSAAKGEALGRAARLFETAKQLLAADAEGLGMRAEAVRVEKLETRFPGAQAAATRGAPARAVAAASGRIGNRQSFEYYWSGRRMFDAHKRIRLVKVETDAQGNVLRTSVVHSS